MDPVAVHMPGRAKATGRLERQPFQSRAGPLERQPFQGRADRLAGLLGVGYQGRSFLLAS